MAHGSTARAAALTALLLGTAAAAQGPRSILPPSMAPAPVVEAQAEAPAEKPAAPAEARREAPRAPAAAPAAAAPAAPAGAPDAAEPGTDAEAQDAPPPPESPPVERLGLLEAAQGGYGDGLWAGDDARWLAALMDRIDAPLGSRWMQIVAQRALLSRATAPAGLNPATFGAARAQALVRMGAAADAHRMLLDVPGDRYTVPLFAVAAQAALAAGDPLALCPLAATARAVGDGLHWELAELYCASLDGGESLAAEGFDDARRRKDVNSFDVGLAERIAGASGNTRRVANPNFEDVESLDAWRLGAASATGLSLPDALMATAGPAERAWTFRLAGASSARRAEMAAVAVGTGAAGSQEANRLFAARAAELAPEALAESTEGQVRAAWSAADADDRLSAMRALLDDRTGTEREGWLAILGPAAARIGPAALPAGDAAAVVDSLLAAGLVARARQWAGALDPETRATLAPQMLLLGQDTDLDAWSGTAGEERAARAVAALQGLGLGPGGTAPLANDWTRAMDAALAARRPGRVVMLAASALRVPWEAVPPDHLRRVVAGLAAIGRRDEAVLIAAEAARR